MKFIARFIFSFLANAAAIWLAAYWITGFALFDGWRNLLTAALILTLLNFFVRPLLKFFLGPFVILTFGFFTLVINGLILYLFDIFSQSITINGLKPLILATLVIGLINSLAATIRADWGE